MSLIFTMLLRVRGSYEPCFDIGILADTANWLSTISALEEAFAESNLPFWVDVVDLHRCSETFRQLVFANYVRI